jgi:pimeloyl-ACP methyl ester carboxylesterase
LRNNLASGQLIVLKKSGHFPFVEEREEYTRVVSEFLRN